MYDYKALNYHKFADVADIISWDNYPQWHKKEEHLTAMDSGMQHDIMRSIQKKPFLLMESCPAATNWQPVSKLKKPGMLHTASLQAIAHGSDSVQYFQLRQSQGSSEKFHGAVIDHYGGDDTRTFKEVTEVGASLEKLGELAGAMTDAKVAVLFDWESRWAMEDAQGPRNEGLYYKETVEKSYFAFRKLGLNVDVIDMEQSLEGYKVVAIPMLYMFRDGFEDKVREFVKNGGTAIMTYWSGIVDETDFCFLEGTPHGLMDVFGLRSMEIDALYDHENNHIVSMNDSNIKISNQWKCKNLCDIVNVSTAKTLGVYGEDFYKDSPAFTVNNYENGKAYYICADFEQGFYDEAYAQIVQDAKVNLPIAMITEGVEVTTRQTEEYMYIFIQNYNRKAVELNLDMEGKEILLGVYENNFIQPLTTIVVKSMIKDTVDA